MWALGTGIGAAAITALRAPFMFDRFWAEDGTLFYHEALVGGRPTSFTHEYAGYLHTVPRAIAAISVVFPVRQAPAAFAVCILAIIAAGAALIEACSGAYLDRRWLRVVLALSVAFLPILGEEVIGNAANMQFILVFFAFWLLLWFPRRWPMIVLSALALLAISLSTLIALVVLPVALARLLVRRRRGTWLPALALLAGMVVQFVVHAVAHDPREVKGAQLADVWEWFDLRILSNLRPEASISDPVHDVVWVVVVLAAGALLVGTFIGSRSDAGDPADEPDGTATADGGARRTVAARGPAVARTMVVTCVALCLASSFGVGMTSGAALRYAVLPSLFLVAALVVAADHTLTVRPGARGLVPVGVVVGAILVSAFLGRQPGSWRGEVGSWSAGADAARAQCGSETQGVVDVESLPLPWIVVVPCQDLVG